MSETKHASSPKTIRPGPDSIFVSHSDWTKAHESAQQDEGPTGAWVHAYLHRKEGDSSNAAYWYCPAGKSPAKSSLEDEWSEITGSLLR